MDLELQKLEFSLVWFRLHIIFKSLLISLLNFCSKNKCSKLELLIMLFDFNRGGNSLITVNLVRLVNKLKIEKFCPK